MESVWNLRYATELPAAECIQKIMETPWEFKCEWGTPLWYKCEIVSPTRLFVTFTGGQFRKIKRTQYWMDFSLENGRTVITMSFYKELVNLSPFTLAGDIDLFMEQRINATRIK